MIVSNSSRNTCPPLRDFRDRETVLWLSKGSNESDRTDDVRNYLLIYSRVSDIAPAAGAANLTDACQRHYLQRRCETQHYRLLRANRNTPLPSVVTSSPAKRGSIARYAATTRQSTGLP